MNPLLFKKPYPFKKQQLHFEKVFAEKLDSIVEKVRQNSPELAEAMKYSCLNGGKRIRPLLVYAARNLQKADSLKLSSQKVHVQQAHLQKQALVDKAADDIAIAIEMLHSYSLIHDDLPAMDNDALRRGKPTCHIVFGEAMAILAGDALQALSFSLLNQAAGSLENRSRHDILNRFSQAAIAMVTGQSMDIVSCQSANRTNQLETGKNTENKDNKISNKNEDYVKQMHQLKTASLVSLSIQLGIIISDNYDEKCLDDFTLFGDYLGLAFQIQDDILDEIGETSTLGKTVGSDRLMDKCTYPQIIGMDKSRQGVQELLEKALSITTPYHEQATELVAIAQYIVNRNT